LQEWSWFGILFWRHGHLQMKWHQQTQLHQPCVCKWHLWIVHKYIFLVINIHHMWPWVVPSFGFNMIVILVVSGEWWMGQPDHVIKDIFNLCFVDSQSDNVKIITTKYHHSKMKFNKCHLQKCMRGSFCHQIWFHHPTTQYISTPSFHNHI